jgi:hypothetical protein
MAGVFNRYKDLLIVSICLLAIVMGIGVVTQVYESYSPKGICLRAAENACKYGRHADSWCKEDEKRRMSLVCYRTLTSSENSQLQSWWHCRASADDIFEWESCESIVVNYFNSRK